MQIYNVSFVKPYKSIIKKIRKEVFTIEQKIDAKEDLDGNDDNASHILLKLNNKFIATGRILNDGHIGRLTVLKKYRNMGYGSILLNALVNIAKDKNQARVFLGAQESAIKFYQKNGFNIYDKPFMEVGIKHFLMEKNLKA